MREVFSSDLDRTRAVQLAQKMRHEIRLAKQQNGAQLMATLESLEDKMRAFSRCFRDSSKPEMWNSSPIKDMQYRARYL